MCWCHTSLIAERRPRGTGSSTLSRCSKRQAPSRQSVLWRWTAIDAPGGYLLFTEGYRPYLEQVQRAGWPSRTLPGGHFHMLVDPAAVAATLF
ncbi:MAG TPA: hypothetical protein VF043_18370 [Ktedonobacteraceae bacterium]